MTAVRARYFPATVRFPDEPTPRRKQYVLLAEHGDHGGLHVWSRPGDVADRHEFVDWAATTIPPGRGARNGVSVHLADGRIVVVTLGAGCRCGPLGRWAGPAWATTVQAAAS